jgi:predicted cobalt transporter CbtA
MKKALLFSLILATLYLPIRASKLKSLRKGLLETLVAFSAFCVLYLIGLLWVYPALK